MASPILVFGHKNPDNDSICSAVAYAYLKNELAKRTGEDNREHYVAARLGQMPPESSWILQEYGIEQPVVVTHVHTRVNDVMTEDLVSIGSESSMLEAGKLLREHNIRSLVVEDDDGRFLGLIGTRAIAERYMSATDALEEGDPASTMAVASSLINSLSQKVSELMAQNVLVLNEEGLLKEAASDLIASELREGVVLDDNGRALGIVTRSDVTGAHKRRVILVDHNETLQSAPGIEEAEVVEVVDHHRIADVSTAHPIQFINLPLGSTATIVTLEFRKYGVEIPESMAAVLLSAIMTDTVLLKSPTATPSDKEQADYLSQILGEDAIEFGLKVFKARGADDDMPVKELVEADSKEFDYGDATVLIAQHETVDLQAVLAREDEIRAHMEQLRADHGYEFVLLMVTDIMAEGSQFLAVGNLRAINRAFNIRCTGKGGTWMPGILSRKKQVASRILN